MAPRSLHLCHGSACQCASADVSSCDCAAGAAGDVAGQEMPAWMQAHAAAQAAEQRRKAAQARAERLRAAQAKLAAAKLQRQQVNLLLARTCSVTTSMEGHYIRTSPVHNDLGRCDFSMTAVAATV